MLKQITYAWNSYDDMTCVEQVYEQKKCVQQHRRRHRRHQPVNNSNSIASNNNNNIKNGIEIPHNELVSPKHEQTYDQTHTHKE